MDDIPRRWQCPDAAPTGTDRLFSPRSVLAFELLASMVIILCLIAGMLAWYRPAPNPSLLPLWVADYQSSLILPPPHAPRDRAALLQAEFWPRLIDDPGASPTGYDFERGLDRLGGLHRDQPIVVYLGGVAMTGPEGAVAVLPSDARLDRPEGWVRLGTVLERLRACPSRHKLLVLDILGGAPPEATLIDPSDVSGRIEAELRMVEDPNRLVLCPSSPGQVPLASEALGRSIFGAYLDRGLRGEADGFGPSLRDHRVSVIELAAYLADRVDAWAVRNRGARQVPQLLGMHPGADFALLALRRARPGPTSLSAPRYYPAWLLEAWQERDTLWDRAAHRAAPRVFRAIESILLRAEHDWRGGADPRRIKKRTASKLAAMRRRLADAESITWPRQTSLAQERARGREPEEGPFDALTKVLADLDLLAAPPGQDDLTKALDALGKSLQGRPNFDVSSAIWRAARSPELELGRLRFLRDLDERLEPEPRYVETLWLRRVADVSQPTPAWPIDIIRRSLRVAELGETATCRPRSILWSRAFLDEAAQARHDSDVILLAPGYAPPGRVEHHLDRAESALLSLATRQGAIEGARDRLDDALVLLQDLRPVLDRHPDLESNWRAAVRAASDVSRHLGASLGDDPAGPGRNSVPRLGHLRDQSQRLDELLASLRSPFLPGTSELLAAAASGPQFAPGPRAAIEVQLSSVLPRAGDRPLLWKALLEADRKTLERGPVSGRPAASPNRDGDLRATIRRHASLDLLGFAGLVPPSPDAPEGLYEYWVVSFPQLFDGKPSWLGDQRMRVAPLAIEDGQFEDPRASPVQLLRVHELSEVWAWLADHNLYEARDLGPASFYAVAAEDIRRFARVGPPARSWVEFSAAVPTLDLSRGGRTVVSELGYRVLGPISLGEAGGASVSIINSDDPWMRVRVVEPAGPSSLHLSGLAAVDDEHFATPPPLGVIVAVRLAGRSFHAKVPVRLPTALDALEVQLGRTPDPTSEPMADIALRPNQPPEAVHLFAKNPTPIPIDAIVTLEDTDGQLLAEPARIKVGARSTLPIPFKAPVPQAVTSPNGLPPPPPPPSDRPFRGPLRVVFRDPRRHAAAPVVRVVPVSALAPRDYVEVVSARYTPAGQSGRGKDRLEVQVRRVASGAGADPMVELVLDPDQIPGFIRAEGGTFRVTPRASGGIVTLVAEGFVFADGEVRRGGTFSLTVDGYARAFAFRATFPTTGEPVTPLPVGLPGLALQAPAAGLSGPLSVRLGADGAPEDASIELGLEPVDPPSAQADTRLRLDAPRDLRFRCVSAGPDDAARGVLRFAASVQDWAIKIPADGIVGRRLLRARLIDSEGAELAEAMRSVDLERRPATEIVILGVPDEAGKGTTLTPEAFVGAPASGIAAVDFFLGPPPHDGKLPVTTTLFPARPRAGGGAWVTSLMLPDAVGPVNLSVRVLSRAGLSGYATARLRLLDSLPIRPGRVVGRVAEGDRPQPGLKVDLVDGEGTLVLSTTSGRGGQFAIEGVKPGKYKVLITKPDSGTRSESGLFEMKPGTTVGLSLELLL